MHCCRDYWLRMKFLHHDRTCIIEFLRLQKVATEHYFSGLHVGKKQIIPVSFSLSLFPRPAIPFSRIVFPSEGTKLNYDETGPIALLCINLFSLGCNNRFLLSKFFFAKFKMINYYQINSYLLLKIIM